LRKNEQRFSLMYIQTSLHLGSGMILIFKNTNNNTLAALFYKIV